MVVCLSRRKPRHCNGLPAVASQEFLSLHRALNDDVLFMISSTWLHLCDENPLIACYVFRCARTPSQKHRNRVPWQLIMTTIPVCYHYIFEIYATWNSFCIESNHFSFPWPVKAPEVRWKPWTHPLHSAQANQITAFNKVGERIVFKRSGHALFSDQFDCFALYKLGNRSLKGLLVKHF